MSIRSRLTLWYTAILALTLLIFGTALIGFFSYKIYDDIRASLRDQADVVTSRIEIVPLQGDTVVVTLPNLRDFKSSGLFLQSYTFSNGQWDKSSNLRTPLPYSQEMFDRAKQMEPSFQQITVNGDEHLLIYYSPMAYKNQVIGVLEVATEVSWIANFLSSLRFVLVLSALFTVVLAATIGWYLARKALQPIEGVIVAANKIEKGADLGLRIQYDGPKDEIGRLTDTINNMLGRVQSTYMELEDAYRKQRRFVSDASHELRTPLTTIRGNVELLNRMWLPRGGKDSSEPPALDAPEEPPAEARAIEPAAAPPAQSADDKMRYTLEAMHDISDEAERMSRLVNDLLALARADAGFEMVKEPLQLQPLVEEVIRRANFLPKKAAWEVGDTSALEGVQVNGNKDYLQQMLFIFIENAFKYTESGQVRLDSQRYADQIGIRISDTGIGMNKEEIPLIFDRFYRADVSRGKTSGTGLGLSIAKWIIDEHGGSVEVTSKLNEGTTFLIWLPMDLARLG